MRCSGCLSAVNAPQTHRVRAISQQAHQAHSKVLKSSSAYLTRYLFGSTNIRRVWPGRSSGNGARNVVPGAAAAESPVSLVPISRAQATIEVQDRVRRLGVLELEPRPSLRSIPSIAVTGYSNHSEQLEQPVVASELASVATNGHHEQQQISEQYARPPPPALSIDSINHRPAKNRLFRRIFTHLDPLRLHAGSGSLVLLLTGYETVRSLVDICLLHQTPGMEGAWVLPSFLLVNMVKDVTGLQMTLKHRKGVLLPVFVNSALVSWSMGWLMLYYTPLASSPFVHMAVRVLMAGSLPLVAYLGIFLCFKDMAAIKESRDEKGKAGSEIGLDWSLNSAASKGALRLGHTVKSLLESAMYLGPMIIPNLIIVCAASRVVFGGWDLREIDMLNCPSAGDLGLLGGYVGLLAGNLGTLAPTLRDRKLISRSTECALVGLPFLLFIVAYGGMIPIVGWEDWWYSMQMTCSIL